MQLGKKMNQAIIAMQNPLPNVVGQSGGSSQGQERRNAGEDVFNARRIVSWLHGAIAFMSMICGVVVLTAFRYYDGYYCQPIRRSAVGVWCGMICLITAVWGAFKMKNYVLNFIYLVFSMFTLIATVVGITLAGYGVARCYHTEVYYIILLCLNALALLLSIIESSLTCSEWGCCTPTPTVLHYNTGGSVPQQPVNPVVLHTYGPPSNVHRVSIQADPYYFEPEDLLAYQSLEPNRPYYESTIHNEA